MAYKKASYIKFLDARENFIVDGTGGGRQEMISKKAELEEAGFDVGMILVDLDLETAIARNKARGEGGGRELLNRELESSHSAVTRNINFYKQLFGNNFFYVDASEDKMKIRHRKNKTAS